MSKGKKTWLIDEYGEVKETGRFKTDEQIQADIKFMEQKRIKEAQQKENGIKDKFIWAYFDEQSKMFPELKPQDVTRLIYIATYCDYSDNILKIKGKNIDATKLKDIMLLNNPQYYSWYNLMIKLGYIEKIVDGYKINVDFFNKGKILQNGNATRVFIATVRNLYENLRTVDHYKLGYLLRLIPFINPYSNSLVENVNEADISKLKPLKLSYLADILGYSKKNIRKLANELLSIKYGEKQLPLIGLFALNSLTVDDMFVIINAKIFFGGSCEQQNKVLSLFESN